MRNYELLVTLPGTLTKTELKPELEQIKSTLEEFGSENIESKSFSKTKLAYPVDGIEYGYYYQFKYEIDPQQVNDMRKELNKQQNLLRSVLNQIDPNHHKDRVDEVRSLNGRDEILQLIEEKHSDKEESEETQQEEKAEKANSKQEDTEQQSTKQEEKTEDTESTESSEEDEKKKTKKDKNEEKKKKEKDSKQQDKKNTEDSEEDVSLDDIDDKLDEIIEGEDLPEV
jgi:ribosomal protein S6